MYTPNQFDLRNKNKLIEKFDKLYDELDNEIEASPVKFIADAIDEKYDREMYQIFKTSEEKKKKLKKIMASINSSKKTLSNVLLKDSDDHELDDKISNWKHDIEFETQKLKENAQQIEEIKSLKNVFHELDERLTNREEKLKPQNQKPEIEPLRQKESIKKFEVPKILPKDDNKKVEVQRIMPREDNKKYEVPKSIPKDDSKKIEVQKIITKDDKKKLEQFRQNLFKTDRFVPEKKIASTTPMGKSLKKADLEPTPKASEKNFTKNEISHSPINIRPILNTSKQESRELKTQQQKDDFLVKYLLERSATGTKTTIPKEKMTDKDKETAFYRNLAKIMGKEAESSKEAEEEQKRDEKTKFEERIKASSEEVKKLEAKIRNSENQIKILESSWKQEKGILISKEKKYNAFSNFEITFMKIKERHKQLVADYTEILESHKKLEEEYKKNFL